MENPGENKVVLVGESGVGKTCILDQYIRKKFTEGQFPTLAAQFCRKNFKLSDGRSITLDIWDTAGQEKFRSLNRIFYKNAKAVVLVYDITDKKSFDEIKNYWYDQIKQNCASNVIIAIAANKCDLYEEKEISDEEGEEFAKSKDAFFAFTSAKNDSGITNLFENIAMKILEPNFDLNDITKGTNKNKKENSNNSLKLNSDIQNKKKKCC